jgi:hypothetical protein
MGFGAVIPVIGLNNGFLGRITRSGPRGIVARQVLASTASPIPFSATVFMVPDSLGGTVQTVKDFIGGGGTMTAALLAGIAVANVKTQLTFPLPVGQAQIGQYNQGEMCEYLQEGSINVAINNGAPVAGNPVFLRVALNGAIPAGVVGGLEAVADGANSISLASVGIVFRTGVLDANGIAEITLKTRIAA